MQWTGQQAVVTFPQHIDISNVGQIREQLLWIINRGAAVLIADLTGTVSCDCSGADALARAQHRAVANGTELRLAVTANAVRRVLTLNGFDRLVAIYPDLDAAAAGPGRREQRTRTADDPARTEELLDGAVAGLFAVGLVLQGSIDLPRDVTAQRITEALRRLDEIVREIRNHVFAGRGQSTEPGLAGIPPPHVLERSALAGNRPELLQRRVVQTANAVQSAAAEIGALLDRHAVLLTQPGHVDYPTEIKRWAALADQAGQLAECWI